MMNEVDTNETIPLYQNSLSNISSNVPSNIAPIPNQIPPISYDQNEQICPICLSALTSHETRQTVCYHTFHKHCIERWMLYNTTCPSCRHVLVDNVDNLVINDLPEYPNVNDELIDYLPYRFVCGRLRCCYYQIPPSFALTLQLISMIFLFFILFNTAMSWDGSFFDYLSLILSSTIFLFLLVLHILLRYNLRIQNCRIVSIHIEDEIL